VPVLVPAEGRIHTGEGRQWQAKKPYRLPSEGPLDLVCGAFVDVFENFLNIVVFFAQIRGIFDQVVFVVVIKQVVIIVIIGICDNHILDD